MNPLRMMVVTGTRPELIKLSVFLRLAEKDPEISLIFVHSGQHYDDNLFGVFLRELELPNPHYNIEVGSAPNSVQTGQMLIKLYDIVQKEHPSVIIAQGDTNTVFAAALTAFKNDIPFAHVEAGIRSYDWRMPEEVNRILTSCGTLINFAPTSRAAENLIAAGVFPNRIFVVGNPIVDAVLQNLEIAKKKSKLGQIIKMQSSEKVIVVTAHRPSNVDTKDALTRVIEGLTGHNNVRIIFPIHPRTRARIKEFELEDMIRKAGNIELIEPLGYLEFLDLMARAAFFITDSGGMQEEAVVLKKPCLTLRENTERPETVEMGSNILVGNNTELIRSSVQKLLNDPAFYSKMIPSGNPFGDGTSATQMIAILKEHYKSKLLAIPTASYYNQIPRIKLDNCSENISVKKYEEKHNCIILEMFGLNGFTIVPSADQMLQKGMKLRCFYINSKNDNVET